MGTCTFIDYMIGTISFSRLYKMDTVFFCDFCTAVQCAPKLGVFYLKCWQSTDLSEGVYSASIETNPLCNELWLCLPSSNSVNTWNLHNANTR
jgi:hypothetical protein